MSRRSWIQGKRLRVILLFLLAISFAYSFQIRRKAEISEGYEVPTPKVDPGPDAATLRVTIVDRDSGEKISATASVNRGAQEPEDDPYQEYSLRKAGNELQGPSRFRELDYYFYTDGTFSVRVPPGICRVAVGRGYEYNPVQRVFHLEKNEVIEATIALSRWIDMAKEGWYSGDTHLHFERTGSNDATLLTLTSARDIRYAFSLSMNTTGYALGREFESWGQALGLGEESTRRKGPYYLSSGQEYRVGSLGHVTVVLAKDYVPASGRTEDVKQGPSLGVIADQSHELSGFIGLNHGGYYRMEADALGLSGKTDFLELLQLGGYGGLGLDGWYDFLNLGYHWAMVGASDFPYSRELGGNLTYVYSEGEPTVRSFMEALVEGRSFATSGPMVFLEVNGRRPGEKIVFNRERKAELEVSVRVLSPLYPVRSVDLIWNGRVLSRQFDPKGRARWEVSESLRVEESGWLAVRAHGDEGTESHTNPVYVYLGGKRPFDDDACGQILARLEASTRSITQPGIRKQLMRLASSLSHYRDTGENRDLALPEVP